MKNKTKRIVGCSFIVISIILAIIIFSSKIETQTIKDLSALWDSSRVGSYTLDSGNVIPIPNGFYYVGGDIETGVIISDNAEDAYDSTGEVDKTTHEYAYNLKGNQFVWISCDLVDFIKCDKWNGIKQNSTSLANVAWDDSLSMDELLQVAKYGGYYVARYEAGLDETFQEYTSVQYNSGSNQCFNKEGTPQSKINQIPWNLIDWETAKTSAEKMYDTDDVKSGLITGAQWDTMLNQMVKLGVLTDEDLTSSSEIGNYIDTSERDYKGRLSRFYYSSGYWYAPLFTEERKEKTVNYNASTYGEMLTTGICEQNQFYNIFDIAGNAWEWTDELTATDCGVARGGSCINGSSESPVCYRYGSSKITDTGINIGYRVTLKLPTEEKDKKLLEYTVEYNKGNSGNGSMSSDVFYYGIKTPLKKNTFTHSKGIDFCGWAYEPDGTVKYVDEQIVTRLAMPGEKITLYAVFYDVVNKPDTSAFNQDTTFYVWWDENGNEQNYIPVWMDPPSDWYSYADRKWANIVTRNDGEETYFVWIPRYEYSLDEETQRVNVNLLAKKTAINHEGYTIPEAFWWDKNGDGEETEDEELEGYWITKYQLSESTNSVRINAPMASIGGDTIHIGDITGSLITEAQTNGSTLKYYYYLDGKLIDTGTSSTQHFVYENLKYNKDYTVNIVARNSNDEFVGAVTKTISTNPANPPVLDDYDPETTFYVVYDDEGNETRVPITEPEPENWYNYTIQKKAYIVSTKDEVDRYYVWVPRYEYSLSEEINTTNTAYILGTDKERDIVYIRGTSSLTDDNYVIPAEFDTQPLGYWLTVSDANKPDTSQFNQQHTFYVWWDENGNEQNYIPVAQDPPSQWYDYKEGKWANIVTRSDGEETYYVWIPRYEYQLNEAEQRVDVQFIPGKLTQADNLYTIPEAFWWDANGDGEETPDEELEGYWITKYQLSESTNETRITAATSAIGGDTLRIGDIVGSLITATEGAGVEVEYQYYLNGELKHTGYSSTEHYTYTGLSCDEEYVINIIARRVDDDQFIGAITKTISTNPANPPELGDYDPETTFYVLNYGSESETRIPITESVPKDWYNYSAQKKAYIVSTKDEVDRYYVWVPRYEYSLSETVETTNTAYILGTDKERDIVYIRGTSTLTDDNYVIPAEFDTQPLGYWLTVSDANKPDTSQFNQQHTFYVWWDEDGNEQNYIPVAQDPPSQWYDYKKGKWANIVTRNDGEETYYVWIPRYEYQLNEVEQRVDVRFIPGKLTQTDNLYTIPEAFWWDANGDGEETPDEELEGYWITKYQLSDTTNDKRITAPMSSIGGDTIRIGDIVGSLITEAESAGVTIEYQYYLDGKYIGHNYSSTGHFVYEGLSNYTDYTINIIARNADTKAYIGAITRTISTNPANAPEIDEFDKDTTYYVTYDIKGNETRTSFNSPKPLNWYNYAMQKKAYIVSTKDGVDRYYVWVPRYEYSLSEEVQTTNTDYIFGTKKERDIIYIRGTSVLTDTNYRIPDVFTEHPTGYWATISQPNAPEIDKFNKSCTYYVVYDDDGNETRVPLTSSPPSNWYDYDKQKWANIVTTANSTETYYVWIPRYQYKLNNEEQRVDVIFLPGTINEPDDGYTIPEAFWWDANGDGEETPDEELTGYWITKYQLGG